METKIILEMLTEQNKQLKNITKKLENTASSSGDADTEQQEQLITQIDSISTKIDSFSNDLKSVSVSSKEQIAQLSDRLGDVQKPMKRENRYIIDVKNPPTFYLILSLVGSVILLALTTFKALEPHQSEQDNDLKYRYIKMKGFATPETLTELEDIFKLNRNNTQIREMHRTVESYEEAIRKRAILDEQTRLKQQESNKLNREATELKAK